MKRFVRTFCFLLAMIFVLTACDQVFCKHRDADDDSFCDSCGTNYADGTDVVVDTSTSVEPNTVQSVYLEAQKLGYTGSLDEFLALCKGKDGLGITKVEINANGDLLVYYTNAPTTAINLGKIIGSKGETGEAGLTPFIGLNGNWWIGSTDTGVKAKGETGAAGITPQIRINSTTNEWEISTDSGKTWVSTGTKAQGSASGACANGHTPGEWVADERENICEDIIKRKFCTVCECVLDVGIEQGAGHMEIEDEEVIEATCTTPGLWQLYCEFCGDVLFEMEIEPGHNPGDWKYVPATGNASPTWEKRCTECGELLESIDRNPGVGLIDPEKDENGRVKDDLDQYDLNYGGETITLLYWKDVERPEFEQKEITNDNVLDAIYDRTISVEDRLNIDLEFIPMYAAYGDGVREEFLRHIDAVRLAQTHDYDIIATMARTEAGLAIRGHLQDLSRVEESYINLEKPWWPKTLVDTVSFGNGSYYFVSGDMSTNVIHMMHMIFINKDMFADLKMDLPYQDVRDGKWTIDRMIEITKDVWIDLDGNNVQSKDDQLGFCALNYVCDSFYPAANMRYFEQDDLEMLKISPDYTSAKAVRLFSKLGDWASGNAIWITNSSKADKNSDTRSLFRKGKTLMWLEHACYLESSLGYGRVDFDYGVVPTPKYDENQVNYYTGMGNPWSLYGIFVDLDDRGDKQEALSMVTAVLECYASENYRIVIPELFEVNMQLKYLSSDDDRTMLEYVRSGIVFDLGKIFAADTDNLPERASNAIVANSSWSDTYPKYLPSAEEKLKKIVSDFKQEQAAG